MIDIKKIYVIGNGNVGSHLYKKLKDVGFIVELIGGRDFISEKIFIEISDDNSIDSNFSNNKTLYIIAVADKYIADIANKINGIYNNDYSKNSSIYWIHTSANFDETTLLKHHNKATFYPFQTFTKNINIDWSHLPIIINSENKEFEKILSEIAYKLTDTVLFYTKEQLSWLHIAAVFACNFSNHLWSISEDILQKHNIDFNIIKPLLYQSLNKIETISLEEAQTGPAIRKDKHTLRKQLSMLTPWYRKIYKTLTKSIQIKIQIKN
ncbi:hypothetical protein FACS1894153_0220 [Bacteroidia bacterium]|nr:hypothetical protein FACS1894153_0220 [Bacteroidia bacterium]